MARRRAAQGLTRPPPPDAVLVERAGRRRAVDFEVELACNGLFGAAGARRSSCAAASSRASIPRRGGSSTTSRRCGARGRRPTASTRLGPASSRGAQPLLQRPATARVLARLLRAPERDARARARGDRPRAPRHGLALAARRDLAQVRAHVHAPAAYMDEYPEYRFACSQAQQYAWIEERDPSCGSASARAVDGGAVRPGRRHVDRARLQHPLGRVARAPVPARPALLRARVRPPLHRVLEPGRRSATTASCRSSCAGRAIDALPHAEALVEPLHEPEHHTFTWQGIDGSEVLAHFPPADTYNARGDGRRSCGGRARDYKDHGARGTSLLVFGHGDGGGGPTRAMLETLRRVADLQGLPRTRCATPEEFFDALEAEPRERPTVVGELYFEYHRGTYTSQARTKRGNRRCEPALHDAEFLSSRRAAASTRAPSSTGSGSCCCFSSSTTSCPGSSIGLVYEDAERDLAEVEAGAEAICGGRSAAGAGPVNTIGVARREVVAARTARRVVEAPPYGFGRGRRAGAPVTRRRARARERAPARGARAGRHRRSASSRSRPGREALAAPGNRLELYDDRPVAFDAWDIDPFHLETRRDCPPADVAACSRRRRCAPRSLRARDRRAQPADADRPPRRRLAAARVPHDRRLARGAHAAEGLLPARRARAAGDLRDAVRLRRAADALLHGARRRDVRGAGPPLRRPVGARLRRGAPDRLQVRLQLPTAASCGSACCARRRARTRTRTWAGTSSPTRSCRTPAAGARPASSPRLRASTRHCAGTARARAGDVVRRGRRRPRARHDQARGRLGRDRAAAVRARRRARVGDACGSPPRSRRRASRTCSRTRGSRSSSTATRSSSRTGRTRS